MHIGEWDQPEPTSSDEEDGHLSQSTPKGRNGVEGITNLTVRRWRCQKPSSCLDSWSLFFSCSVVFFCLFTLISYCLLCKVHPSIFRRVPVPSAIAIACLCPCCLYYYLELTRCRMDFFYPYTSSFGPCPPELTAASFGSVKGIHRENAFFAFTLYLRSRWWYNNIW